MLWIVHPPRSRCIWGSGDRCESGSGRLEEGMVFVGDIELDLERNSISEHARGHQDRINAFNH